MAPTPTYCEDILVNNDNDEGIGKFDRVDFPYEIRDVEENVNKELLSYFTGERTKFIRVGQKKWFFHSGFQKEAANYYNFQVRPDDVIVLSFPRSGTTWTQEMVWLIANDLNYGKADDIPLTERFTFLEFSAFVHPEVKAEFVKENETDAEKLEFVDSIDFPGWRYLENLNERRFIKTHLPFSLLPPNILNIGCKIVYVARNPKDVAVSFYHLNRSIRTQGYIGDFPRYWNYFEHNLQPWTPYWEHLKEAWNRRNEENMLFLFYEDLKKDLRTSLETVSEFFGKKYSAEEYLRLEDHLNISNFKNNRSVNGNELKDLGIIKREEEGFIRNGGSGGWKNYFTPELKERADRWIEMNLRDTDIRFPEL